MPDARPVLVSACLLGERCRYDGRDKPSARVQAALEGCRVVAVCPEVAGGLPVPRPPCDLAGGDGSAVWAHGACVVGVDGVDRTAAFVAGARACLERAPDATLAVLKARSPSCGTDRVTVDGHLVPGRGVFAALLHSLGIPALSDEDVAAGIRLPPLGGRGGPPTGEP